MNRIMKNILCTLFSAVTFTAFAQADYTVEELLCGYLENDLELQKLALSVEKSELNLQSTKIDQGFDVSLSTGTMKFYSNGDSSVVSVKPSIKAALPSVKNLTATVSSDYELDNAKNINRIQDTKISLSLDLLSQTEAVQKINLLKSERELLETQRQLQNTALKAEKEFYTELSNILKKINSIYTRMQDVYTDKLAFDKLKAQGYTKTSTTYRIAEMKVMTAEHDVETTVRELKHDFLIFYQHCGVSINVAEDKEIIQFVPSQIPETLILNFSSFPKDKYTEIEKAKWNNSINTLVRKADKFFSLGLNAGYTFSNSVTKSDTVDAGVSAVFGGIGVNAGVSLPVGLEDFAPSFSLSATVSPNLFRKRSITEKTYDLTEQQELIDIKSAEKNYDTALVDFEESLVNLDWEKLSVKESFELYQRTESDLQKYFKNGIVTESEYLTARNNRLLYQVKIDLNKIDYLLYNNSVRSQFYDLTDEDIKSASY